MTDRRGLRALRGLGVRYVNPRPAAKRRDVPAPAAVEERRDVPAPREAVLPAAKPVKAPPSPSASAAPTGALERYHLEIRECQKCPLGKTRKRFVFGSGDPRACVVFVGEAPGADEDEQGLPFVGRAGQLLTKIIESTKTWKREEVYICNVLKCRPPGNRPPQPEEVEQCRPYLEEQIRRIQPLLIVAMGASAAQALLRTKESVGKLRNRWHEYAGVPLWVTYHPAALLRTEAYKRDVWEDMKVLTARYLELKKP